MTALRRLLHRGVVSASGLAFDRLLLEGNTVARRALDAWTPGTALFSAGSWVVLLWPVPRWLHTDDAPGLPLVRVADVLTSAPLDAKTLAALPRSPAESDVVLVAQSKPFRLPRLTPLEPHTLLELGPVETLQVTSLAAPRVPVTIQPIAVEPPKRLEEVLGVAIERDAAAQGELVKSIQASREAGPRTEPVKVVEGWRRIVARQLQRLVRVVQRWRIEREPVPALPEPRGQALSFPNQPPKPGLFDRLNDWISKQLLNAGLADWLGRKHAEYLASLFEMLDQGDLDAALRHALPLRKDDDTDEPGRLSLAPPKPREKVELDLQQRARGGGMNVGIGELYAQLQAKYRSMVEKLKRAGRVEDVAFVLSELLGDHAAAVSWLESQKRHDLAAKLAEARALAPELIVRQWFLAGEVQRAIDVARRYAVFALAVERLTKLDAVKGRALRAEWARFEANSGHFTTAVSVAWPDVVPIEELLGWLEKGVASGGSAESHLLPKLVALRPDRFTFAKERLGLLLDRARTGDDSDLQNFAVQCAYLSNGPLISALSREARDALATLLRPCIRTLLRDGLPPGTRQMIEGLAGASGDPAVAVDLPELRPREGITPLVNVEKALIHHWSATDRGTRPILDAQAMNGGRILVALGEGGAKLLDFQGRTLLTFDRPAHKLVLHDTGATALLLAPRDDRWLVSVADLATGEVREWLDFPLVAWAPDYDGRHWVVATTDRLHLLDATAPTLRSDWSVAGLGKFVSIARSASRVHALTAGTELTHHEWELPRLELRNKLPLAERTTGDATAQVSMQGTIVAHGFGGEGDAIYVFWSGRMVPWPVDFQGPGPRRLQVSDAWFTDARDSHVILHSYTRNADVFALYFGTGAKPAPRLGPRYLTVCDRLGRLVVVDLMNGALRADLRL